MIRQALFTLIFLFPALAWGCETDYSHLGGVERRALAADYVANPNVAAQFGKTIFPHHRSSGRPVSTSEATLKEDMTTKIIPFFQSGQMGKLTGEKGVELSYRAWEVPNPKGAVVIMHGIGESAGRYPEVVYNLAENGYSVYLMDHRGHGMSGRMTEKRDRVYVDDFDNYARDQKTFIDKVVRPDRYPQTMALAVSMGGMVGIRMEEMYPGTVDKLATLVPMVAMKTKGIPLPIAQLLSGTLSRLGMKDAFAFGETPPATTASQDAAEGSSPQTARRKAIAEAHFELEPSEYHVGGATFGWAYTALKRSAKGRNQADKIKIPVLMLSSENDNRVQPEAHEAFCKDRGNCQLIKLPQEASHGVMSMPDPLRDQVFQHIFDFAGDTTPQKTQ